MPKFFMIGAVVVVVIILLALVFSGILRLSSSTLLVKTVTPKEGANAAVFPQVLGCKLDQCRISKLLCKLIHCIRHICSSIGHYSKKCMAATTGMSDEPPLIAIKGYIQARYSHGVLSI